MTRQTDSGFTLIESLVALSVFSVVGVALLNATKFDLEQIQTLQTRNVALWSVQNAAAEIMLTKNINTSPLRMLGYDISIETNRSATSDSNLARIDITATVKRASSQLTVFVPIATVEAP